MKKRIIAFMLVIAMGLALTACAGNDKKDPEATPPTEQGASDNSGNGAGNQSNDNDGDKDKEPDNDNEQQPSDNDGNGAANITAESTPAEMVDAILSIVEQPSLIAMDAQMVKDMYHLDPAIAEQLAIKMPMMNVKTNEIAIFKAKDDASKAAIEEGMKKRAADVQKQFETYLPDQYENAKNYKIVTNDKYMLFVISESADQIVETFNSFFEAK